MIRKKRLSYLTSIISQQKVLSRNKKFSMILRLLYFANIIINFDIRISYNTTARKFKCIPLINNLKINQTFSNEILEVISLSNIHIVIPVFMIINTIKQHQFITTISRLYKL